MEHNVIDNREVKLRDELLRLLPHCDAGAFALGYFFLSGWREIHEPLSRLSRLRILMSGHTNLETAEALLGAYKTVDEAKRELDRWRIPNPEKLKERIAESRREFSESLELLEPEDASVTAVRGLLDMVKNRRLDVRLYVRGTLHAKCYLLYPRDPTIVRGLGIVGSSNLSISGLEHNAELNLKTDHPADFAKLCKWFDELWEDAEEFREDFLRILDRSWAGTYAYTPRDIYYKALYERVRDRFEEGEALEDFLPTEFPQLFEFQRLALRLGVQSVRRFNGVIIGDVVGLGKTYIGAALMRTLEREGYRPLVICPPHLEHMWRSFCGRFEVNAKVLSHGMLRQQDFEPLGEIEFRDRDLVLIDESHNFRHRDTLQYEKLYRYMQAQGRSAILVTATPLANTPLDIYNQIRLFHEGDETRIPIKAANLKSFFDAVEEGTADLRELLSKIMIRRTRKFIMEHYGERDAKGRPCLRLNGEAWYFPERRLKTLDYDVDRTYDGRYQEILERISRKYLTLARYGLYNYLKPSARGLERYAALNRVGPQLLGLMRKILLKRMESSVEAFRKTIQTLADVYRIFLSAVDAGAVPAGEDQQDMIYEAAREGGRTGAELDALISEIAAMSKEYDLNDFDATRLREDLTKDLDTFEGLLGLLVRMKPDHDDKLKQLDELVASIDRGKKVIVFTEYADTALYLDQYLKTRRAKAVVYSDVRGARTIENIVRRFAPNYNLRPGEELREPELDLLVSTDILSEGMNLQDARVVINYDLHWNPTRLIQRIGRVDRFSREPMTVEVYNFLPSRKIERELSLERRLRERIAEIHRVIGEDARILHPDEQLNEHAMYAIYQRLELAEGEDGEERFGLDRVEQELRELMKSDPEYWKSIVEMPCGVRSAAPAVEKQPWGALVACRQGDLEEWLVVRSEGEVSPVDWDAAHRILGYVRDSAPTEHPSTGNELVAAALLQFKRSQRALDARRGRVAAVSPEQRWALEQIARAQQETRDKARKSELGRLFEAYQRPITLPAARSELRRLRRSERDAPGAPARVLERLREIYSTYDLGRREGITAPIPTRDVPRVLWACFVPDAALGQLIREADA